MISTHRPPIRVERELQVTNRFGMHARPATEFVQCALQFKSAIYFYVGGERYSARRVMDIMLAKLTPGTRFVVIAEGEDAERAVETLDRLLRSLDDSGNEEDPRIQACRMQRVDLAGD